MQPLGTALMEQIGGLQNPQRKCHGALCLETFLDPQVSEALPLPQGMLSKYNPCT